jgi:hypothetical protein
MNLKVTFIRLALPRPTTGYDFCVLSVAEKKIESNTTDHWSVAGGTADTINRG